VQSTAPQEPAACTQASGRARTCGGLCGLGFLKPRALTLSSVISRAPAPAGGSGRRWCGRVPYTTCGGGPRPQRVSRCAHTHTHVCIRVTGWVRTYLWGPGRKATPPALAGNMKGVYAKQKWPFKEGASWSQMTNMCMRPRMAWTAQKRAANHGYNASLGHITRTDRPPQHSTQQWSHPPSCSDYDAERPQAQPKAAQRDGPSSARRASSQDQSAQHWGSPPSNPGPAATRAWRANTPALLWGAALAGWHLLVLIEWLVGLAHDSPPA
jgi:hypothetical protein